MFRILSLDGGGIRGAFAAAFLYRLELQIGCPISDYFDLIAGTSTGGIIALALCLGEPAEKICKLYRDCGPAIFTPRKSVDLSRFQRLCAKAAKWRFRSLDEAALYRSKYTSDALRELLTAVFGTRTLEDAKASRALIPAVNLTTGRTIVFKTPHQPKFIRDRYITAVDVALAASAAPTFFPQACIGPGSAYADGGLWANNPAMLAYAEAVKIHGIAKRDELDPTFGIDEIHMVSIGTGEPEYYARPAPGDDGLLWWADKLFEVASGAESQGVDFQAQYVLGPERYQRIDFKMPSNPWRLDDVTAVPELLHYGEQAAIDAYPSIKDQFLAKKKQQYHPFPPD
jgi:patatin-like phospholipase/acyl hydrolase